MKRFKITVIMEKVCSGIRVYKIYAFNKNVLSAYSVPDLVRVFRYLSNNLQYGQSVHLCDFFLKQNSEAQIYRRTAVALPKIDKCTGK